MLKTTLYHVMVGILIGFLIGLGIATSLFFYNPTGSQTSTQTTITFTKTIETLKTSTVYISRTKTTTSYEESTWTKYLTITETQTATKYTTSTKTITEVEATLHGWITIGPKNFTLYLGDDEEGNQIYQIGAGKVNSISYNSRDPNILYIVGVEPSVREVFLRASMVDEPGFR